MNNLHLKKFNMKIKKSDLSTFFITIAFLYPPLASYIPILNTIVRYTEFIAMIVVLFYVVFGYKKLSKLSIFWFLYWMTYISSTVLCHGDVAKSINAVAPKMLFGLYLDYMFNKNPRSMLKSLCNVYSLYIIVNAVILIIFPQGLGSYIPNYDAAAVDSRLSLLALDNSYIKWFIPAVAVFIIVLNNNKRYRNFLISVMVFTMIYVWSGTGSICMALILLYIIFLDGRSISKIFNFVTCELLAIIAFIGVVVCRVQDYFSSFIVGFLGKDITFTGRTYLWDVAMFLIAKQPIQGYGVYDYALLLSPINGQPYSAHNTILQMLLMGGSITLMAYIIFLIICGIKLMQNRNLNFVSLISVLILISQIACMTENTIFEMQFYILFILGYHIKHLKLER